MLPGVELARRRRVHYHGDVAASSAAEHAHHHHHYGHSYCAHHAASSTTGPALAARNRLEEKLRGAALPSRLMRDGRSTTLRHPQITWRDEQDFLLTTDAEPEPEPWRPAALLQAATSASAVPSSSASRQQRRRAELTRTLSKVDLCAVCLDEVRPERRQRVTRLPCSHKYHSECVLPWLAVHPDCPCCRALVPSADTLVVQVGDIAS